MKNWTYSLLFVPLYMALFVFWQWLPSRVAFVAASFLVAGIMSWLIVRAKRSGYFANRVDLFLHIYVVIDVLLEGLVFEFLLLSDRFGWLTTQEANELRNLVLTFHDNQHFYGCTAFFVIAIGLNRWWALWVRDRRQGRREQADDNRVAAASSE